MSEYVECETNIKDERALVEALIEMGFEESQIERHEQAQPLYGYHGDKRKQKSNVIIRRQHVGGASNDIGFLKKEDGTYEAIISAYDRSSGGNAAKHTGGYNDQWMKNLNQNYTEKLYTREARKLGYKVKKEQKGKKIQLTLYK